MQMKYCPGCGREVRAGANFCGKCGHQLKSAPPQGLAGQAAVVTEAEHQVKTARPAKNKRRGRKLVTFLLLLIVAMGAVYVSPLGKDLLRRALETGFESSGVSKTGNSDYSPGRINVAHQTGKSPSPGPGSDEIDDEVISGDKIEQATKNIEQALLSGEQDRIRDIMTDNALSLYGKELSGLGREELVRFGEAFKSRELKTFSSMYTEYAINLDGQEFTISLARQSDGSWKIMRF